jgi:hypothetical protein
MNLNLWLNSRDTCLSTRLLFNNDCRYLDDVLTVNNLNFLTLDKETDVD